jgi:hypothetical protein
VVLGFKLRVSLLLARSSNTSAIPPDLFWVECFRDRVSETIYPGWLWTTILLISVSWVARVTGISHLTWRFTGWLNLCEFSFLSSLYILVTNPWSDV